MRSEPLRAVIIGHMSPRSKEEAVSKTYQRRRLPRVGEKVGSKKRKDKIYHACATAPDEI